MNPFVPINIPNQPSLSTSHNIHIDSSDSSSSHQSGIPNNNSQRYVTCIEVDEERHTQPTAIPPNRQNQTHIIPHAQLISLQHNEHSQLSPIATKFSGSSTISSLLLSEQPMNMTITGSSRRNDQNGQISQLSPIATKFTRSPTSSSSPLSDQSMNIPGSSVSLRKSSGRLVTIDTINSNPATPSSLFIKKNKKNRSILPGLPQSSTSSPVRSGEVSFMSTSSDDRSIKSPCPSHASQDNRYKVGSHKAKTVGRGLFIMSILLVIGLIIFVNVLLYSKSLQSQLFRTNLNPDGSSPTRDPINKRKLLRMDRTDKGFYFGVSIDWENNDTPVKFNRRLGKSSSVFQHFMDMGPTLERVDELKFIVDSILQVDGALHAITIIPIKGLDVITKAGIDQIGRVMASINKQGVPVLLRFAHEMNGNWYKYGQKPAAYVRSYIAVHDAVRQYTNQTYMVWAPNTRFGYPWFGPTDMNAPRAGTADFIAMDTNSDGKINELDDPFTPYYPGDKYVDWVGFSVFHFGPPEQLTRNGLPRPTDFINLIQFEASPGVVWDIYTMFALKHNKPMVIMETSAAYHPERTVVGDPTELEIKRAWWRQVFSEDVHVKFPLLKLICWFDIKKIELVLGTTDLRDFRVTGSSAILNSFLNDLPKKTVFFADSGID